MFEKVITFSAHEDYVAIKEDYPIPIKLNIPKWFKNLNHSSEIKTVKGCMPFLDTLTSGYLLKMPQDFHIRHNVVNKEGRQDSFFKFGLDQEQKVLNYKAVNLNSNNLQTHSIDQLEGSPFIKKNKELSFYKILNPWKIKTPKGYSCLIRPIHKLQRK